MIPALRHAFNAAWTPGQFADMRARVERRAGAHVPFPLSETPCFFPRALMDELAATGADLVQQIVGSPSAMQAARAVVPERYRGPGAGDRPQFIQVDFGLVRGEDGRVRPKLVELQAFASLYGFQLAMAEAYHAAFALPESLGHFFGGIDTAAYLDLVRQAMVGDHDPEQVVLMEIQPRLQKTWPDFAVTESLWGVKAIDTGDVEREGRRLFYRRDGRRIPIARVYNRVIPDELDHKGVVLPFDYRDELDVEWAGHPAWFFQLSKFSIPFLKHESVPKTWFLHELDRLPDDREHYLLKPLFSFAGGGITFAPTDADVAAIPADQRRNYILQERIAFTPLFETPDGPTQAEIRVMYVWTDRPRAVLPLIRMGRGKMMGVDHNKGLHWVGASAGFITNPVPFSSRSSGAPSTSAGVPDATA